MKQHKVIKMEEYSNEEDEINKITNDLFLKAINNLAIEEEYLEDYHKEE